MGELAGKVALVTGGGSGIGREIAVLFAREGAHVAILDINDGLSEQVVRVLAGQQLSAEAFHCDVSREAEVEAAVAAVVGRFGRLDVLANSAGVSLGTGRTDETAPEVWHSTIAVNLTGTFLMMRFALPAMSRGSGGSIINIGSIYGLTGRPGDVAYAASKGGVIQLTRTAALEYAKRGIRVNCICPGFVETSLLEGQTGSVASLVGTVTIPMGRLGTPAEIADFALFLASDRASFVTGAIISIDGGMSAR